MGRLSPEKVRWIIQAKRRGEATRYVAWSQGVSERRVQQLWRAYRVTGEVPVLKPPGRPRKPIPRDERQAILEAYQATDLGALNLERILLTRGKKIPHNRIHRVLKDAAKAKDEPKKQRRRKWVRYERAYSMELWHSDWKQLPNGNWFISFQDDASRFIVNYGEFPERNAANVLVVLEEAVRRYGCPDAILTDRGSEFYASAHKDKSVQGVSQFTTRLEELGIRHILARVNHPQTNGKLERFHGEIEKRWDRFDGDVRKIVEWQNHVKPHLSLRWNRAETPGQAFIRKYSPERVFQDVGAWFWTRTSVEPPREPTVSRGSKG